MYLMMKKIFLMPLPWNLWVMALGLVNLLGGLYFFQGLEGKMALVAMMGAMLVMLMIFKNCGFVRLMGLGHIIFWTPFLFFSLWRISSGQLPNDLKAWLTLVSVFNGTSLVLDFWDLTRYLKGERAEM